MALTLRIIRSKAGVEGAIMYEIVDGYREGLPGYNVEYGDWDDNAIDEIIDGRNVTTIVVTYNNHEMWAVVSEYCKANGVEYRNLCG